jgi:NitT/TauT family transport system substrate-binding protein
MQSTPSRSDDTRRAHRRLSIVGPSLLVLIAMAVVLGTWGGGDGAPAHAPLRVGINPWPGYGFAMLADSLGYYEDEGVEVRLVEQSSLGDSRRAFDRHQVDGMFGTIVEVITSEQSHGHPVEVVLVADYSDGSDMILAHPDIPDLAGLRGKRIGAEPGTLTEVVLSLALRRAGLSTNDVDVRWISALEMPRAFEQGRIDAAVCYPPVSVEIADLGGHRVFDSSQIPGVVLDVLAFDAATAAARADEIEAIKRAFFRAQRYAERHPDEAYAVMARRQGITKEDFESALTEGVRVLGEGDQDAFLGPNGSLGQIRGTIERELRQLEPRGLTAVPLPNSAGVGGEP